MTQYHTRPFEMSLFEKEKFIPGQAQEIKSQSKSIADTYWRNDATGDWIIGFVSKYVIQMETFLGNYLT